jgi:hypothetical protein
MAAEELVVKALPEGFDETNDKLETTDEKFEEVSGSVTDSTGILSSVSDKFSQTFSGIVNSVATATSDLLSQIPIINEIMSGLMSVISSDKFDITPKEFIIKALPNGFNQANEKLERTDEKLTGSSESARDMSVILSSLSQQFNEAFPPVSVEGFDQANEKLERTDEKLTGSSESARDMSVILSSLSQQFNEAFPPVSVEGFDQADEKLERVDNKFEQVSESVEESTGLLSSLANKFGGALSAIVAGVAVATAGLLSQVPILGEVVSGLTSVINAVAFQLDKRLRPVLGPVRDGLFELAQAIFEGNFGKAEQIIKDFVDAVASIDFGQVFASITDAVDGILVKIQDAFSGGTAKGLVDRILGLLSGFVNFAVNRIVGFIQDVIVALSGTETDNVLAEFLVDTLDALSDFTTSATTAITSFLGGLNYGSIINTITAGLTGETQELTSGLISLVMSVNWSKITRKLKQEFESSTKEALTDAVKNIDVGNLIEAINPYAGIGVEVAEGVMNQTMSITPQVSEEIDDQTMGITPQISEEIDDQTMSITPQISEEIDDQTTDALPQTSEGVNDQTAEINNQGRVTNDSTGGDTYLDGFEVSKRIGRYGHDRVTTRGGATGL